MGNQREASQIKPEGSSKAVLRGLICSIHPIIHPLTTSLELWKCSGNALECSGKVLGVLWEYSGTALDALDCPGERFGEL